MHQSILVTTPYGICTIVLWPSQQDFIWTHLAMSSHLRKKRSAGWITILPLESIAVPMAQTAATY